MEIPHAKMLISSFYCGFSIARLHGISGRDEQCSGVTSAAALSIWLV
jgi:hypothetical protein